MQSRWSAAILGDREDPRRRLAAIFGGEVPVGGQPPVPALAWAERLIGDAGSVGVGRGDGVDVGDEMRAIRRLRQAEPRLTLKAAAFLARHALRSR
ncbi:hypothetical protein [Agromyces aerolatus]|uniref:hypothetical protein n=1 Tax=Agromyces sp. LY-1074 TaxID=3074080 RepID=UPI0028638D50|nr:MULTISPECIES: hypothetical protein [unclassified Agromyces]MDR5699667.1 hypothetical protein [Agromyces sp. LY-1074]MDR5705963.1 hypothetical protein [Agromyces sp. LY-1358]